MMGAPNSLNPNCKVRAIKEAPGPSVSEEIADIFRNYNKDDVIRLHSVAGSSLRSQYEWPYGTYSSTYVQ